MYPVSFKVFRDVFCIEKYNAFLTQAKILNDFIQNTQKGQETVKCQSYLSKQHNLCTPSYYKNIRFPEGVVAQHFNNYGSKGHNLSYFVERNNLPLFIKNDFISALVSEFPYLSELKTAQKVNFAFNFYKGCHVETPEFPFHIDTPSNAYH